MRRFCFLFFFFFLFASCQYEFKTEVVEIIDRTETYTTFVKDGNNLNCKVIAHRGLHTEYPQNTIEAYLAAIESGFKWLEIDIRQTADGVYVMSHDDKVKLYKKDGTSASLTFSLNDYDKYKNTYYWDNEYKYKVATLAEVFASTKGSDVYLICDRKSGTNEDIVKLASLFGVTDKIVISSKLSTLSENLELLNKYPYIPIRCSVPYYTLENIEVLSKVNNPVYADINISSATPDLMKIRLSNAMALGLPIIMAGCTMDNTEIWSVIANGVMANSSVNISYEQFYNELKWNPSSKCVSINSDIKSLEIEVNKEFEFDISSDSSDKAGYVYVYSENPLVVNCVNQTFGSKISAKVIGTGNGSTNIIAFCASGEIIKIPVICIGKEVL